MKEIEFDVEKFWRGGIRLYFISNMDLLEKDMEKIDRKLVISIILIYKKLLDLIWTGIVYMYKVGDVAKRYWTKKKLFLKYNFKRDYSSNVLVEGNDVNKNHRQEILIPMKLEEENNLNNLFSHIKIIDSKVVEVKEVKDIKIQIDKAIKEINIEKEVIEVFPRYKVNNILKMYEEYNENKINIELKKKGIGIILLNYTTSNKNSIPIVLPNKIKEGKLNKGLYLHINNVLFTRIRTDKEFIQVFTYIIRNIKDDLSQRIIIERNTYIKDIDNFYNKNAEKILMQIGIKRIIIENNIKTKAELLEYLYDNWEQIRK